MMDRSNQAAASVILITKGVPSQTELKRRYLISRKIVERNRELLFFKVIRKRLLWVRITGCAALIAVLVLPPAYGAHGLQRGVYPALKSGLETYLMFVLFLGHLRSLALSLVLGYGFGMIGDDPTPVMAPNLVDSTKAAITILFFIGLSLGIGAGVVTYESFYARAVRYFRKPTDKESRPSRIPSTLLPAFCIAVTFAFLYVLLTIHMMTAPFSRSRPLGFRTLMGLIDAAFAMFVGLSAFIGVCLGVPLGRFLRDKLRPGLLALNDTIPYLREMVAPLIGFALGYLLIAFMLGNIFWAVWRLDPCCAFKNLSATPSFGDFFYFSIVTIATLGYGDITPSSGLAKGLASAEVILGLGWITVVFAAIVARLQPRFADIYQRQKARRSRL